MIAVAQQTSLALPWWAWAGIAVSFLPTWAITRRCDRRRPR